MKVYTGDSNVKVFEHLFETDNQVVTHLVLKAGEVLDRHKTDHTVVVVPIKGKVIFSVDDASDEIYPGKIVQMVPDEMHKLEAIEDSELMVVKSHLR